MYLNTTSLYGRLSPYGGGGGEAGFTSTNYQAIYDEMTTPPDAAIALAQDTFVKALEDGSIWAKLDSLMVFAQQSNTASEALMNWINPTATKGSTNNMTFTSLEGLKGNGTDSFINTVPDISTMTKYTLNSASFGFYSRTDSAEAVSTDIGWRVGSTFATILGRTTTVGSFRVNDELASAGAASDSLGMYCAVREGANVRKLYKNKSIIDQDTQVSVSIPTNGTFYVGAYNRIGIATYGSSSRQYAMSFIGAALTQTDINVLTDAFEVYMDSNSKGVIT